MINKKEHSISAIYLIVCLVNCKIYIGSAINLYRRFHAYKAGDEGDRPVIRAMKKYGFENFIFTVLEEVKDKTQLIKREQYYLDTFKPFNLLGYNICPIAGSCLGVKHGPEICTKISKSKKAANKALKVLQVDQNSLEVINEYPSAEKAAENMGVSGTMIRDVCNGTYLSSAGYAWCYKDRYNPSTFKPRKRKVRGGPINGRAAKPVIQYTLDGTQIRIWDHALAVQAELGISSLCINFACNGRIKSSGGYRWAFVTDKGIIEEVNNRRKEQWRIQHADN